MPKIDYELIERWQENKGGGMNDSRQSNGKNTRNGRTFIKNEKESI